MSNNELNNFDQLLKSKLDQHSVPFNEGEWSRLEKNLPKKVSAPLFKNPWIWSGAAVVAILLTSVFLLNTNTENQLDDTIVVNVNKENNKLNKVSPEDIEHQNNKTIKTVISNNVEENTNIDNTAQESFKSQDNSDIAEQDEQSNTKDAETIASNNETEALENTVPTVDSSLSPSYTPEDFNEAVNVKSPMLKLATIALKNVQEVNSFSKQVIRKTWTSYGVLEMKLLVKNRTLFTFSTNQVHTK